MNDLKNLPQWAVVEAGTLVPPDEKKTSLWSKFYNRVSSLVGKNHIEDYQKRGHRPIILVGCDIKNINAIINASDYDERRRSEIMQ